MRKDQARRASSRVLRHRTPRRRSCRESTVKPTALVPLHRNVAALVAPTAAIRPLVPSLTLHASRVIEISGRKSLREPVIQAAQSLSGAMSKVEGVLQQLKSFYCNETTIPRFLPVERR